MKYFVFFGWLILSVLDLKALVPFKEILIKVNLTKKKKKNFKTATAEH